MARNLSVGCTGSDVEELQRRLNYRLPGSSVPLKVDRIFGPKTDAAVRLYQKLHNLTVDGIVGPLTRGFLNKRLFLMRGVLYREIPERKSPPITAAGISRQQFAQAMPAPITQQQPAPPPQPSTATTVVQLQPGLTAVLPPWIFPPGQQPGTILQRSLQLSVV